MSISSSNPPRTSSVSLSYLLTPPTSMSTLSLHTRGVTLRNSSPLKLPSKLPIPHEGIVVVVVVFEVLPFSVIAIILISFRPLFASPLLLLPVTIFPPMTTLFAEDDSCFFLFSRIQLPLYRSTMVFVERNSSSTDRNCSFALICICLVRV